MKLARCFILKVNIIFETKVWKCFTILEMRGITVSISQKKVNVISISYQLVLPDKIPKNIAQANTKLNITTHIPYHPTCMALYSIFTGI